MSNLRVNEALPVVEIDKVAIEVDKSIYRVRDASHSNASITVDCDTFDDALIYINELVSDYACWERSMFAIEFYADYEDVDVTDPNDTLRYDADVDAWLN